MLGRWREREGKLRTRRVESKKRENETEEKWKGEERR